MADELQHIENNTVKGRKRQAQVEAGAYDGRYITKVVEDKKKKQSKEACKKFKQSANLED
jgi:hypothetical protein